MENVLKLGDFIELVGFDNVDGGSMIIIKKMIGNSIKELSERVRDFERFSVHLVQSGGFAMHGVMTVGGREIEAESKGSNLFIVMDGLLKSIDSSAR